MHHAEIEMQDQPTRAPEIHDLAAKAETRELRELILATYHLAASRKNWEGMQVATQQLIQLESLRKHVP